MPQLIRLSLLVTVPVPVPVLLTVRVVGGRKFAVIAMAELPIVTEQVVPVAVVHPVQPLKVELLVAVAVSVTTAFG